MSARRVSPSFVVRASCLVASLPLAALAAFACDETPRGEQGIDFLDDGAVYTVPSNDSGSDARGPCTEGNDPGACAHTTAEGIPAAHLILCAPGNVPVDLICVAADAAASDAAFCCTTGLL